MFKHHFTQKKSFFHVFRGKICLTKNLWIKHSTSGANLKKTFFAKFYTKIVPFFAFLKLCSTKNAENEYFDQRLGQTLVEIYKTLQFNFFLFSVSKDSLSRLKIFIGKFFFVQEFTICIQYFLQSVFF